MLNDTDLYCNAWGLKINVNKTKVLIFEKGGRHSNYNYLGGYFLKNGNWFRMQKCIAEHASKAMSKLFSILNQYEFKTQEKCRLFDTLVASVLNYSSEVWGYNEAKDIELIHTKCLRNFFVLISQLM